MSKEDYKLLLWCQTFLPNKRDATTRSRWGFFGFLPGFFFDFFQYLWISVWFFWISQTLLPKMRGRYQQKPATTRRKNFDVDFFYDYDYPINAEEPSRKVEERLWTKLEAKNLYKKWAGDLVIGIWERNIYHLCQKIYLIFLCSFLLFLIFLL